MEKLTSLMNHLTGTNLASIAFASYLVKMLITSPSFPDALAITALSALVGYSLYIKSKMPAPINDKIQKDLENLQNAVSSLKLERSVPTTKNTRYF